MSNNKRKVQSFEYGAIILLVSTLLVKVIGAVFKIPLNNIIGDLGFGYFSSAYDLFTPIYSLSMAGLPIAVSRMVAENMACARYKDARQVLSLAKKAFFVTGLAGFAVMLALIFPFVKLTDASGGSLYSLFAIAPALLFCCVMSTYRGYYEGLRNMYPTAVSDLIEALSKLVFGFTFAYAVMKISGDVAVAAAAAMVGITLGTMLGALYLRIRYKFKGDLITESELSASPDPIARRAMLKMLIAIAVPVVLGSLATNISSLIDVSMVKWQLQNVMHSDAEVVKNMYAASIADYNATAKYALTDANIPTFLYGIRGKAYTIYNLVPTITSVLGVSALPVLASAWAVDRNNKPEIKKNVESILKFTSVISIPGGIGMAVLAEPIMRLLYTSEASVQIGAPMLVVFGAASAFAGITVPMTSMLQAIGKQLIPVRNIAIGAVIKVTVNFILVGTPKINIHGAPIGTLCCYGSIFILNLCGLVKYSGVRPNIFRTMIKPLIATVPCGIAAWLVSHYIHSSIGTAVAILAAAGVYFAGLVVLRVFEERDVLALPRGEKMLKVLKKVRIIR